MKRNFLIIAAVFAGLVVVSLLVFFYDRGTLQGLSSSGGDTEEGVTEEEPVSAVIDLEDRGDGTVSVFVELSGATKLTGAELFFEVVGDLDITDFTCDERFECIDMSLENDELSVSIFRHPDNVLQSLDGRVKLGDISYDVATSGALVINGDKTDEIFITELGSGENIAKLQEERYTIGNAD